MGPHSLIDTLSLFPLCRVFPLQYPLPLISAVAIVRPPWVSAPDLRLSEGLPECPCQAPMLHVLCFFFRFCNQSESSRDITSQPGYGRSPAKRMCIGHFSACASGRLHVHAARLLFFMSCRSRCSRAAACFLQPSHTMLCVLSFVLLDKSAGAYAALPRSLLQGPAHGYSSGRRALQPRLLHSRHTTFRA